MAAKTPTAHPKHHGELDALARIEGQVRGISKMVEEGRYCMDILAQTRAVQAALRRVERDVLSTHLQSCVRDAFGKGSAADRQAKVDEVLTLFDWQNGRAAR